MTPTAHIETDDIAEKIMQVCLRRELSIVAAESLTGGLLADAFVRVPGASRVFLGSVVTYDIRAKASILGVDAELLRSEGAVHPEVARQMTVGAASLYAGVRDVSHIISLSTTGVAGPGPDGIHPAGEVYIAISLPDDSSQELKSPSASTYVKRLQLEGSRQHIRELTVWNVLTTLAGLIEG